MDTNSINDSLVTCQGLARPTNLLCKLQTQHFSMEHMAARLLEYGHVRAPDTGGKELDNSLTLQDLSPNETIELQPGHSGTAARAAEADLSSLVHRAPIA